MGTRRAATAAAEPLLDRPAVLEVPGIGGRRRIDVREFCGVGLAHQNGACRFQPGNDGGVNVRHPSLTDHRSRLGGHARREEHILRGEGNAVQRAAKVSRRCFSLEFDRPVTRGLSVEMTKRMDCAIEGQFARSVRRADPPATRRRRESRRLPSMPSVPSDSSSVRCVSRAQG
jgi:hypothetical protein